MSKEVQKEKAGEENRTDVSRGVENKNEATTTMSDDNRTIVKRSINVADAFNANFVCRYLRRPQGILPSSMGPSF